MMLRSVCRVQNLVRGNLQLVNDKFRRNREVNQSFFSILRSHKNVRSILKNELPGIPHPLHPGIQAYLLQSPARSYHIYTVDVSLLPWKKLSDLQTVSIVENFPFSPGLPGK
jgi:[protein-PII] uridylyltransferase